MKGLKKKDAAFVLKKLIQMYGYGDRGAVIELLESLGITSVSGQGDVIRDSEVRADKPNRRTPAEGYYWPEEE